MTSNIGSLVLTYHIEYVKDGINISDKFSNTFKPWQVTNDTKMFVRDENFEYTLNPDFIEELDEEENVINEDDRYLKLPAFDYMKEVLLNTTAPLKDILESYIDEEARDGRFN